MIRSNLSILDFRSCERSWCFDHRTFASLPKSPSASPTPVEHQTLFVVGTPKFTGSWCVPNPWTSVVYRRRLMRYTEVCRAVRRSAGGRESQWGAFRTDSTKCPNESWDDAVAASHLRHHEAFGVRVFCTQTSSPTFRKHVTNKDEWIYMFLFIHLFLFVTVL